jgi:hypothetical protein
VRELVTIIPKHPPKHYHMEVFRLMKSSSDRDVVEVVDRLFKYLTDDTIDADDEAAASKAALGIASLEFSALTETLVLVRAMSDEMEHFTGLLTNLLMHKAEEGKRK